MSATWFAIDVYLIACIAFLTCYLLYSPPTSVKDVAMSWIEDALEHLSEDRPVDSDTARSPPDWDAAVEFLRFNRRWIDRASSLITRGELLLGPRESQRSTVAEMLHDVRKGHRMALLPVSTLLEDYFADVRTLIAEFPISAATLAAGLTILVNTVWNLGYFGALGLAVSPLNRDLRDIASTGIGSAIVPIVLFGLYLYFTVDKSLRIRREARRRGADVDTLIEALRFGQHIRHPHYWARHAWSALLILMATAIFTATLADRLYRPMLVHSASFKEPTSLKLIGGFGRYVVGMTADKHLVSLPAVDIKCIEMPAKGNDANPDYPICKDSKPGTGAAHVTISVSPAALDEKWQTFVKRVAQCVPVSKSESDSPLLSPVFIDGDPVHIDRHYYESRPQNWQFVDAPTWPNLRQTDDVLRLAVISLAGSLKGMLKQPYDQRQSVNLIGFASGTDVPAVNQEIALGRAETVAKALRKVTIGPGQTPLCKADNETAAGCIPVRTLGFGEMPSYSWAGVQGDASKRVVLVAICDRDVF